MKRVLLTVLLLLCLMLSACTINIPTDITMPYSSRDYETGEWTVDELKEHLKELGFTDIKTVGHESYFGEYSHSVYCVQIAVDSWKTDSIFTEYEDFTKGGVVSSKNEVLIDYYYTPKALTIENCPDLAEILLGSEDGESMDFIAFANKYDGQYVRFDAYIHEHTTYMGGSKHIINVVAGDSFVEAPKGCIVRIGDQSWGNSIDESVVEGQLVKVYGKVDASQSDYFKMLYIETLALKAR